MLAVDAGRESILSVWQWQWGHLLGKVAVSLYFLNIEIFYGNRRNARLNVLLSYFILQFKGRYPTPK